VGVDPVVEACRGDHGRNVQQAFHATTGRQRRDLAPTTAIKGDGDEGDIQQVADSQPVT
jgi:hypothetical protein